MAEEILNAVMEILPNGKSDFIGDESINWNEDVDDAEARENLTAEDDAPISFGNCNANTNGPVTANASLKDIIQDEQIRKVILNRSRGKLSTVASVTSCDSSPVKKSNSYVLATSPVVLGSILTKEDSPAKGRERDEKIRMLRERKMEEQKKKEEELRESIARAEEVRKRQEEERKKRVEEQRRREEEHRALVEERRRRLWDEEFERRQAIIKKTAEREARIDFKKPYKSGSTSPSKNRARSMGNIQRSKVDATSGATNLKPSGPLGPPKDRGFVVTTKSTTKPREKTPARVRHSVTPAPVSTNHQQEAFDRLRSRRSKTPVLIRNGEELKKTNEEGIKQVISSRGGLMVKSMENSSSLQSKNLKKMKSSWAPSVQKEKEKQEKPKQYAMKAVPRKSTVGPQKPTALLGKIGENGASLVNEGQQSATLDTVASNKEEESEAIKDVLSNNETTTTPMPTLEAAIGIAKKLSQVEEHQRKLAENRRLARERAEQKAEEERIRLENLRIEEEERHKREEEEAKRQEEEELRLLEEAKRIEHERYLKAVEEEAERRRLEEEKAEAEKKEKLEAELKAQEEAERKEKERIEKMKKMAEEKEERKKKLEMIMKRVKADEPISKIDPVRSPTIEDSSNTLSLTTNVTSQPPSINSDAMKHLPGLQETFPRNDAETSSSFKSPLLQKMLGNKIKGVNKPFAVNIVNAETAADDETSKPMDKAIAESKTESSDDVCHLEEESKQVIDFPQNEVSSPSHKKSSGKSSPVQIQTSLATDSQEIESEGRLLLDRDFVSSPELSEKEKIGLLEVDDHMSIVKSLGNVSSDVHDAVNCFIDAINNGSLGLAKVKCDDHAGIQNKSNSAESNHKVDEILDNRSDSVVCEEDIKCLLVDGHDEGILVREASSSPSILPVGEELSTVADHLIGLSNSPTSLLVAPSSDLQSSILSPSNMLVAPKEKSLQSLPAAEVNRREKVVEHCKLSGYTNSDAEEEDDYSNDDSENSQELSARPLKTSSQVGGLVSFDEKIPSIKNKEDAKKKPFDKERETVTDPFGNWSTGLDATNVLPNLFVGPHLPAETTGTGDGLPKNFGIASTISE